MLAIRKEDKLRAALSWDWKEERTATLKRVSMASGGALTILRCCSSSIWRVLSAFLTKAILIRMSYARIRTMQMFSNLNHQSQICSRYRQFCACISALCVDRVFCTLSFAGLRCFYIGHLPSPFAGCRSSWISTVNVRETARYFWEYFLSALKAVNHGRLLFRGACKICSSSVF